MDGEWRGLEVQDIVVVDPEADLIDLRERGRIQLSSGPRLITTLTVGPLTHSELSKTGESDASKRLNSVDAHSLPPSGRQSYYCTWMGS